MTMKAYKVTHTDSEISCVIFAERENYIEDVKELTASRIKVFDEYAELGKVPLSILLQNGWYFPCHNCIDSECSMQDDNIGRIDDNNDLVICKTCTEQ